MKSIVPRRAFLAAVLSVSVTSISTSVVARDDAPVVAAASSMQFAVAEIAKAFAAETGHELRLSFGSSGNFARQIRSGAPFELFIAADEDIILDLFKDGFTTDEGVVYAVGRLVIVAAHGSPLTPDGNLDTLAAMLGSGQITRFAIANPDHAPYGMRAREALQARGIWDALQPFLVRGENVTQAAQFALSGNAQGGITAYSLVLSADLASLGTHDLIPQLLHAPLRQRMVLLPGAGAVAHAFHDYMKEPAAREIMKRYGFDLHEDA